MYLVGCYKFVLLNNYFLYSDGSDSEKENQSFSQPDKEEEDGEQQTQPLRFDSDDDDDDDVPLVSMGKRSRTAGSDTSPEGKKPRLMIDSGDDSADEVVSKSEYKVTFVLLYAVKFKSPLKVSNIYIYRDQKRTAIFFVMGKTKYIKCINVV